MLYKYSYALFSIFSFIVVIRNACDPYYRIFSYDEFSIIDITSFALLTFAGLLVLFFSIYLLSLALVNKKVMRGNQFIFFPTIFSVIANLPVYFLIWINNGDHYGNTEATLFTLGFMTSGFVFGLFWAWRNKVLNSAKGI